MAVGTVTLVNAGDQGGLSRQERYCSVDGQFIPKGQTQAHIDAHTAKGDTVTTTIPAADQ